MRNLLIALMVLIPIRAYPCMNLIPESEMIKAIALQPGAGAKLCDGTEACYCFDGVSDWSVMDLKDVEEDDASKPIYQFEHTSICESAESCKVPDEYCADYPGFTPFVDPPADGKDGLLYCRKLLGYEKHLVKKLVEDPAKKAAKEARLVAEKAAKDAEAQASKDRKARIKAQVGSANSVAALKAIVKDMADELIKE